MKGRVQVVAACGLALCLAGAVAARKKPDNSDPALQQKRALHALNRLTFGPGPGDMAMVSNMGVDNWIELQLHPEKIADTGMQARLAPYRTLNMSAREQLLNFPPNPVLKAVQDGKLPVPKDPYRRAIYEANLVRLEDKQEKKQAQNGSEVSVTPASTKAPAANPIRPERQANHALVEDLSAVDPAARMQRILALSPQEQLVLVKGVPEPKRQALLAGLTPEQRETVLALDNPQGVVNGEVQAAKLLRAVYSDRQLEEVLTDFWFNHFNVFLGKGGERYLVTAYERDVIRPHVLGKFKDLLVATAQSPAMLFYLDNWQSVGPHSDAALGLNGRPNQAQGPPHQRPANGPFGTHPVILHSGRGPQPNRPGADNQQRRSGLNENYARELMELHTLGVNGGYTQKDVTEVARVFTGWTVLEPREGGGFVFKERMHEPGDKLVLGHKIKQRGEKEGMQVLEFLSRRPATARFISTELAQRFVSDEPPATLIDAMSKTFLKTDGDLREVLRTMFRSPEFWAPEAYNAKVKTPFEFVVSSLRATQADITDPQPLLQALNRMGMPLYGMQPPTGYSTKADTWVNSAALLDRMNFALALTNGKLYGTGFDLSRLAGTAAGEGNEPDPYQVQLAMEQTLLSGRVSAQTHEVIERQIAPQAANAAQGAVEYSAPSTSTAMPPVPKAPSNSLNVVAALLLGSPEFQRR